MARSACGTLLILNGAGGVGSMMIQLASRLSVSVI
jgi:NADPH:quinone reductase-like Zn-dependent oxidoreductase